MKRTSKYLNKQFGDWTCIFVGPARVQGKKTKKGKLSKRPYHQSYYYIFEKLSSDNKAKKTIRLSSSQAAQVYKGEIKVDLFAKTWKDLSNPKFEKKIFYHFIDKNKNNIV